MPSNLGPLGHAKKTLYALFVAVPIGVLLTAMIFGFIDAGPDKSARRAT